MLDENLLLDLPTGRSEGMTVYEGKGGSGSASDFVSHLIAFNSIAPQTGAFGPCLPAERNLSAILDALSRSRGRCHPQGRSAA